MNITQTILVLEVISVLLGIVCVMLFLRWKRKKKQAAEIEKLIDNISSQEALRNLKLLEHLTTAYALETEAAKEASEYMVEAEKQFLQQFLQQQLEQTSLTDFYQNLCGLLDQYLYFIPKPDLEKSSSHEDKIQEQKDTEIQRSVNNELAVSDETDLENVEQIIKAEEPEAYEEDLDWEDAFSESGDEMDDTT